MATTVNTNLQVYDEERRSATVETLMQDTEAFNEASNGAITLVANESIGHFRRESMFLQTLHVGRRTTTSVADKTPTNMQMGEVVVPKLHRSYMPEMTRDSLRKIGANGGTFSSAFGRQLAKEKRAGFLNSAILVARSALSGNAAIRHTATAALDYTALIEGQQKFGDASGEIVCWVMHSASHTALMKDAKDTGMDTVAGVLLNRGTPATLGKPVVITDSPALADPATPGNYIVLGIVAGGVNVVESEPDDVVTETVTGQDNLIERIHGEYAFDVETKGFSWVTGSGANPDDAALAVATNYAQVYTDNKSLAGVMISAPVA